MVDILYTKFEEELSSFLFEKYLRLLPSSLQEKNLKYLRWQDRHANLFGKLLLLEGLKIYGASNNVLNELQYNEYSRPFIKGNIDINISHSGGYVICAIGKDVRIGVDIEEIKEIDFSDFKSVMTDEQWSTIKKSPDPIKMFFKFWTFKESMIKADSRGLSIPLLDIHIKDNIVNYDNQNWYLKELKLYSNYCSCLALNKEHVTLNLQEFDFYNYKSEVDGYYSKPLNQRLNFNRETNLITS